MVTNPGYKGDMSAMKHSITLVILFAVAGGAWAAAGSPNANKAMRSSGVQGGLVVHLGCGDGVQTAGLLFNDRFFVHGLDTDAACIQKARKHIRSLGLYGKVSVAAFDGKRLPYVDNLVNLLVADELGGVSQEEVMRVLTPLGVAVIGGKMRVKPWPDGIDGWSHFLHGPDNNAVARDTQVSTPRHLQWTCGPLWSRSHEFLSSISGMISDGGRLFYFVDEGLPGTTDAPIPERWHLVARDAFNGKLLWKRAVEKWGTQGWKRKALRATNRTAPLRFIAGDGHLFVTLGFGAPVSRLDGTTGKTLHVFEGTEGAQELRYLDGMLVVPMGKEGLAVFNAGTGRKLWEAKGNIRAQVTAACNGKVFFQAGQNLCCRTLQDGREIWKPAKRAPVSQLLVFEKYLIAGDARGIEALAADTGKSLWSIKQKASRDALFVARGLLWINSTTGLSLETGKVHTKVAGAGTVLSDGHHLRCYPSRATERFIITPERGAEFISITGGEHTQNDWLRGPCTFGVLPCNGLMYVAPNPCFCYTGVKMTGFNAFAGLKSGDQPLIPDAERLEKGPAYGLVKGLQGHVPDPAMWPAYRHDGRRTGGVSTAVDGDLKKMWSIKLGGKLTQPVVADGMVFIASRETHTLHALDFRNGKTLWTYTAGGRIDSPPAVFGGAVIFGTAHGRVHCLRKKDGQAAWMFRAALTDRLMVAYDQLESPWRVHGSVLVEKGVAYFTAGRSTYLDGGILVYALDAATGKMLHKKTLDTWSRTRVDAVDKPFVPAYHMEGAFSDILVSEGGHIYLGQYKLDLSLREQEVPYILPEPGKKSGAMGRAELMDAPYVEGMAGMQNDEKVQREWQLRNHPALMAALARKHGNASLGDRKMGRHVFATSGFLDDSWFNRTYWMYSETWPGFYIANRAAKTGQILCVDEKNTYAVQAFPRRNLQSPLFTPDKKGYLLFCDDNGNEPVMPEYTRNVPKGIGFTRKRPPVWFLWVPVRIRALVAAQNALFIAGPPDVLDPEDPMASFEGRLGGVLWAVSKQTGEKLAEYKLDSPPVFDGMSAAGGKLYLSTRDGKVICMGTR